MDTIGNTPIVKLEKVNNTNSNIYVKLDHLNPSGSIKDVMAFWMIKMGEKRNELKKGSRIIEVTTGNTGISFAMLSAIKGYKFTAVMPEHMSIERRQIMNIPFCIFSPLDGHQAMKIHLTQSHENTKDLE